MTARYESTQQNLAAEEQDICMKNLLTTARNRAETSLPQVRAVARMRIAHVESASDRGKARVTLEMALDEVHAFPVRDRAVLFKQAQQVAAAFAPDLIKELPTVHRIPAATIPKFS